MSYHEAIDGLSGTTSLFDLFRQGLSTLSVSDYLWQYFHNVLLKSTSTVQCRSCDFYAKRAYCGCYILLSRNKLHIFLQLKLLLCKQRMVRHICHLRDNFPCSCNNMNLCWNFLFEVTIYYVLLCCLIKVSILIVTL